MRCRGEITAFLSLIFILLVSFLLALTESASVQLEKNYRRTDMDRAIYSVFGEYHRGLLEDYGVFGMDIGYGTESYNEQVLVNRLSYYGAMGLQQEITDLQLLTDNQGSAFREQVILYMKDLYGIQIVEDLTGMANQWKEQEIEGQQKLEQIQEATLPDREEAQQPEVEEGQANEAWEAVERVKNSPLLSLIFPRGDSLSDKGILLGETLSHRTLQTGRGSFTLRDDVDGLTGSLLFHEYLQKKFTCATDVLSGENPVSEETDTGQMQEGSTALDYELEYILCGASTDRENLEKVVQRLVAIRFVANYGYLVTDGGKQGEVRATAAVMSALVLNPELAEPLSQILLLVWAFGESIMDIRALLKNGKVPPIKTAESWQLPLVGLLRLGTAEDRNAGMSQEGGMDYTDYLKVLLLIEKRDRLTLRCMDLIEQNLRLQEGEKNFRLDYCMSKIKLHSRAELSRGVSYEFNTYYAYQ